MMKFFRDPTVNMAALLKGANVIGGPINCQLSNMNCVGLYCFLPRVGPGAGMSEIAFLCQSNGTVQYRGV